jgi:hypothetical protein
MLCLGLFLVGICKATELDSCGPHSDVDISALKPKIKKDYYQSEDVVLNVGETLDDLISFQLADWKDGELVTTTNLLLGYYEGDQELSILKHEAAIKSASYHCGQSYSSFLFLSDLPFH